MAWWQLIYFWLLGEGPDVLVVTFASAPGVPNWGGVLGRLAREATPEEKQFDILFVCDGGRNWYSGVSNIPLPPSIVSKSPLHRDSLTAQPTTQTSQFLVISVKYRLPAGGSKNFGEMSCRKTETL